MKKIVSFGLAAALAVGLLAGCASGTTSTEATTATKTEAMTTTAAPVAEKVEITAWFFPSFATQDGEVGKYEQAAIAAFNAKHPNITVKLDMIDFTSGPEKITTALASKTAPDVIFDAPGRIIAWGNQGVLAPLDDLFTADFKKDVANENLIDSCGNGKNYYMYPLSSAPFVMGVNKAVLEKEGLMDMVNTKGDRTWTTEQFDALNKALAAKGYKNAIVFSKDQGGDQGTRAFVANLYSSTITAPDLSKYTINDANGVKGLQYSLDAIKAKTLEAGLAYNGGDAIQQFVKGTVTETLLWAPAMDKSNAQTMKDAGVEILQLPLPSDDGKPTATEFLVNGFCVFNNGDDSKIAAAKQFITFLCDDPTEGPKNVKQTNAFPVRSSYGNLYGDDVTMNFYASMAPYYGTYYNTITGYTKARPSWWQNLQAAQTGEKTAQEALDAYVSAGNDSIANPK